MKSKKSKLKPHPKVPRKSKPALFDRCVEEMFRRVGLKYPCPEFTQDPHWYWNKSWTLEEEKDFRDWMKAELKKEYPRVSANWIEMEVSYFLLAYSWRYAYEREAPDERKGKEKDRRGTKKGTGHLSAKKDVHKG